jgi:hypothetical protein
MPEAEKPLAVQVADLRAYCDVTRELDRPGHRALWAAVGTLAALLAAVIRRLPPEAR